MEGRSVPIGTLADHKSDIAKRVHLLSRPLDDPKLMSDWINKWRDIVDFTIVPVISSAEAAQRIAPQL